MSSEEKRRRLRHFSPEEERDWLTRVPMRHFWTITFQTQKPSRIKQSISVSLTSQYSELRGREVRKLRKKVIFVGYLQVSRRSVCPHRNVLLAPYRDSPFNIVACNPNLAWRLKNSALNSDVASSPLFPSSFFFSTLFQKSIFCPK